MTKKIISALLVLALVAGAAWAVTAWHAGKKVEEQIAADMKLMLTDIHPVIKVVEQKHERGPFSSEGRIVIGFDPDCMTADPNNPNSQMAAHIMEGMRLVYTYKIDHGPRLTSLSLANIEGEVAFDGEIKKMLEQFQIPALLIKHHTRVGFDGINRTVMDAPGWEAKMPDGSAIKAFGLQGSGQSTQGIPKKVTMTLEGKGLEVTDPQGARLVQFEPLLFKADLNYVQPQLALGTMQFKVEGARLSSPFGGPPLFSFKGLDISTLTTQAEDKLIDIAIALRVQEGSGGGFMFKNADYDFAFRRLHFETLLALDKLLNGNMSCTPPDAAQTQQNLDQVGKLGVKLMSYNPEIELKHLGAETNMGVFNFSGRLSARDIKEEDFHAPNPEALKSKIILEGKAEVPAALLQNDPQMEALLLEGLLVLEGASVKTAFTLKDGVLTLNGKPTTPERLFQREPPPEEEAPPPPAVHSAPQAPARRR